MTPLLVVLISSLCACLNVFPVSDSNLGKVGRVDPDQLPPSYDVTDETVLLLMIGRV